MLLYHQHGCLNYTAPPDQVVFDSDPIRVAKLANDPVHDVVDVARDLDDGLGAAVDLRCRLYRAIRNGCANGLDRGDALAQLVVQFAGDGTTLLLQPRLDQLGKPAVLLQLSLGLLRVLVLRDVALDADKMGESALLIDNGRNGDRDLIQGAVLAAIG